jgi:hypothetical protein
MKTKIRITTLAIILLVAGSGLSFAQPGRAARGLNSRPGNFCMSIPDLTDAQKEKITALGEEHRTQMDEMRKAKFDAADIFERNDIAAKMLKAQNEHLKKVEALLTDSQKEYFANNMLSNQRQFAGPGRANRPGQGARFNRGPAGRGNGYRAANRGYQRGPGKGAGRNCYWNRDIQPEN